MLRSKKVGESMRQNMPDFMSDWQTVFLGLSDSCSVISHDIGIIKRKQKKEQTFIGRMVSRMKGRGTKQGATI